MNSASSHHLLSAYLDGELTPSERADVEALLTESAEARREMEELKQVGDLLRQLPDGQLPSTFQTEILYACERKTVLVDSVSDVPTAHVPQGEPLAPPRAASRLSARWWAGVGASLAVLTLALLLVFPPASPDTTSKTLDQITDDHRIDESFHDKLIARTEGLSEPLPRLVSPEKTVPLPQPLERMERKELAASKAEPHFEKSEVADRFAVPAPVLPSDIENSPPAIAQRASRPLSPAIAEADRAEQRLLLAGQPRLVFGTNLKNAPVGQIVEALDHQGQQVAVVKLTVIDRQQGLRDLQVLLQRHRIPLTGTPGANARGPKAGPLPANATSTREDQALVAVYVDATNNQMTSALKELQRETRFQQMVIDAPIAVAQLDPLMTGPGVNSGSQKLSVTIQFGAAHNAASPGGGASSLTAGQSIRMVRPQAIQTAPREESASKEKTLSRTLPPEPAAAPPGEPKSAEAKRKLAEKSKDQNQDQKSPAAPKKMPSQGIGVAKADRPQALERKVPPSLSSTAQDPKSAALRFRSVQIAGNAGGSRQQELSLPANVLESYQQQAAKPEAAQGEIAPERPATALAKPPVPANRMQILFVLVGQAPAEKPNPTPPAADNNGAA